MRKFWLIALLVLTCAIPASALENIYLRPQDAPCKTVLVNAQGTASADITIDGTAGGVAVLAAGTTRCAAVITNSGAADMRCAPTTVTVSSTVGYLVPAGKSLALGLEGQQAWKCIRTGSSTTASVLEAKP